MRRDNNFSKTAQRNKSSRYTAPSPTLSRDLYSIIVIVTNDSSGSLLEDICWQRTFYCLNRKTYKKKLYFFLKMFNNTFRVFRLILFITDKNNYN